MRSVIQEAYVGQDIDTLSWKQWGDALSAAYKAGKNVGLQDETYAVANNTPVTMNVLKKQYMLLQTDAVREDFKPHDLNDGSTTWPSAGEDATNTWASWDRAKIDHFLVSRPFGKWYEIVDDPNDPYTGVIKDVKSPGRAASRKQSPTMNPLRMIFDGLARSSRLTRKMKPARRVSFGAPMLTASRKRTRNLF